MRTIQIELLDFEELEAPQQQKALYKLRDINLSHDWWDFIYNDFKTIVTYLGIELEKDGISFSGFYGQGDGAGFSASVDLKKLVWGISAEAWRSYAPKLGFPLAPPAIDRRVLAIALNGRAGLKPRIIQKSRSYSVVADMGGYPANEKNNHDNIWAQIDQLEYWLENVAKVLSKFLYKSLTDEYEFLTSDEAVTATIISNGYVFTADGETANQLEQLTSTLKN